MRTLSFAVLALFVSFNVNADNAHLSTAINKSFSKQIQSNSNRHSTIVYGGKDISRSIVAAAHESTWIKQFDSIG